VNLRVANWHLSAKLLVIALAMFGFGYAMIPIYRAICEVTGIGLVTPKDQGAAEFARNTQVDTSRRVIVEFDANFSLYSPKLLTLASGDNTIYTVPAGKKALSGRMLNMSNILASVAQTIGSSVGCPIIIGTNRQRLIKGPQRLGIPHPETIGFCPTVISPVIIREGQQGFFKTRDRRFVLL
jgi:hypothetical protein